MKPKKRSKFYNWMLYLTNNESKPKSEWMQDEIYFDMWFLIVGFLCILSAFLVFLLSNLWPKLEMLAWALEGVIWFIFLFDEIRHNRQD